VFGTAILGKVYKNKWVWIFASQYLPGRRCVFAVWPDVPSAGSIGSNSFHAILCVAVEGQVSAIGCTPNVPVPIDLMKIPLHTPSKNDQTRSVDDQ